MRTTLKLENTKKTQHNVLNAYEMVLEIQVSCSVEVHLWKKKHQVGGGLFCLFRVLPLSQAGILKGGLPLESQECMNPEMLMSLMLDVS